MSKQTNNIPRPLCLEYTDAKNEIFSAVNSAIQKHGIPLFLMENIITEVYYQVREGAKAEIQNANTAYQKQLDAGGQKNE